MADVILETRAITKRFPGVVALKDVGFQLEAGEIHALCGENGAGKSTLIKILGGIIGHAEYEGELVVRGAPARFESIRDAEVAKIAVIYQELALIDGMTVAENVFLGHEPSRLGFVDHGRMYVDTQRVLERFNLKLDPTLRVGDLGMGQKQLVEIARALAKDARILILDEPTSALSDREVALLLEILKELRKAGVSCIYISHKLDEVFALADRITVLRDGQSITTLRASETDAGRVVQHMVGRAVEDLFPKSTATPGEVLLSVKDLSAAERRGEPARLEHIGFDVRAGEVVGIGGLMGAGRSELLMHLFGCWGERRSGSVHFRGQPLEGLKPPEIVARGLVLVTEDRKRFGLSLLASVGFNLSLSALSEFSSAGFVDADRELSRNRELSKSLSIKAASLEVPVGTLSGGNQQKVVLGRALMTAPKVVMLDEPTRGIDVGAKNEIYLLIRELSRQGLGVLLVSSELAELQGLADTIVMLREGKVGGVFDPKRATQADLLEAAMKERRSERPGPNTAERAG
ncbi:MAG: sugar ABC transporter ATP-binding protein [Polyangiaceae bacterium]